MLEIDNLELANDGFSKFKINMNCANNLIRNLKVILKFPLIEAKLCNALLKNIFSGKKMKFREIYIEVKMRQKGIFHFSENLIELELQLMGFPTRHCFWSFCLKIGPDARFDTFLCNFLER